MQSSHDSLCSSDGLSFSDSERVEDDSDVFLCDGRGSPSRQAHISREEVGVARLGSQWLCDDFGNRDTSLGGSDPDSVFHSTMVTSSTGSNRDKGRPKQTEGDVLFARKCAELQGFVRPLLELLNGLKNGRFDRGLSTFQQSVAMDRIQRIVGVLQKPTTGEKHLHTLLQVEMLLKLWFPQVSPHAPVGPWLISGHSLIPETPPHKHRDQLHIPVKKRKLSWSDTDTSPPPTHGKSFPPVREDERRDEHRPELAKSSLAVSCSGQRDGSLVRLKEPVRAREGDKLETIEAESSAYKVTPLSEPRLTWVHVAPILSPPKSCPSHNGTESKKRNFAVTPPATRGSPETQDCSISSTTPFSDPRHLSFQLYQPFKCQPENVAEETMAFGGGAMETFQGQIKSLPPLLKPLHIADEVGNPTRT